jgi:hypothetical protein
MSNLSRLSRLELSEAYKAADYLCAVGEALDGELAIKIDTLRADLAAAIEDHAPADAGEGRPAEGTRTP